MFFKQSSRVDTAMQTSPLIIFISGGKSLKSQGGGSHWSNNEPDNRDGYDACLVLTQVYGLEWGDVRCFHADLAGYGFLCEYSKPITVIYSQTQSQ